MSDRLRWGVLGTGNIARQFCNSMRTSKRGTLAAVGSRQIDSASIFAQAYGIPRAFGSYDQLLQCTEVDAVYVSLPNSMHHEWTLKALARGKHVLCEKPFASNRAQAVEMFDAAHRAQRILVDGFMYRSHPLTHAVVAAVQNGMIGEPKLVRTSFCYRTTRTGDNIRFRADLAGGSLMDTGCYCIEFSRLLAAAEPSSLHATGVLHPNGVDEMAVGLMRFPNGVCATFTCGMTVQTDNTAYICGTEGYIEIPVPWKPPATGAVWHLAHSTPPIMDQTGANSTQKLAGLNRVRQTFTVNAPADLFALEADDFAAAVLDQAPPRITREQTLGTMAVLDQMRLQLGVNMEAPPAQ